MISAPHLCKAPQHLWSLKLVIKPVVMKLLDFGKETLTNSAVAITMAKTMFFKVCLLAEEPLRYSALIS